MSNEFQCKYCEKCYASLSSRSNHIRLKHNVNNKPLISIHDKHDISINPSSHFKYKCNYCDNLYEHFQSRWRHEKKCKNKENSDELKNYPEDILDLKKEINELKNTIKTLTCNNTQNINNQLNQHFNAPINNNLIQLGRENLRDN